ncbi:MAG: ntrC [Rickettsiaceae bacterium]|jgi:two-component system nitrogen regulation response regulator GlnG|nr:ntrC [Rickettsiaceae bacterium]
MQKKNISLGQSIKDHLQKFFEMHGNTEPSSGLYEDIIKEVEKALITETLHYVGNIQSKAAKILGINRNTLRKKIQEYNIPN